MELLNKFLAFFTPELLAIMGWSAVVVFVVCAAYFKLFLKPKIDAARNQQAPIIPNKQTYRKPRF